MFAVIVTDFRVRTLHRLRCFILFLHFRPSILPFSPPLSPFPFPTHMRFTVTSQSTVVQVVVISLWMWWWQWWSSHSRWSDQSLTLTGLQCPLNSQLLVYHTIYKHWPPWGSVCVCVCVCVFKRGAIFVLPCIYVCLPGQYSHVQTKAKPLSIERFNMSARYQRNNSLDLHSVLKLSKYSLSKSIHYILHSVFLMCVVKKRRKTKKEEKNMSNHREAIVSPCQSGQSVHHSPLRKVIHKWKTFKTVANLPSRWWNSIQGQTVL